jgi:2'-5' RNA ligase
MIPKKHLYFIALLPPHTLAMQIHFIKEEIAVKYRSKYALKIPEHITLIPPFHCSDELLETIIDRLKNLCHEKHPFEVVLRNFGQFNKSVLYIQASSHPIEAIAMLHQAVKKVLVEEFSSVKFPQNGGKFTPHLTIANKDLTKSNFKRAWEELGKKNFEAEFLVNSICLLNHVNGLWERAVDIPFGN